MTILTLTGIDHTVGSDWIKNVERKIFGDNSGMGRVEFAILRSPKVGQSARYPTRDVIRKITQYVYPEQLAFHLCGEYARMVFAGRWLELCDIIDFDSVSRVQVNSLESDEKAMLMLMRFSVHIKKPVIMQWRGESFPYAGGLDLLQDRSGGRGELPSEWISPDALSMKSARDFRINRMPIGRIGYAGGLNPDNIKEQLPKIMKAAKSRSPWIDCESGIRTDDLFDKDKAEAMMLAMAEYRKGE